MRARKADDTQAEIVAALRRHGVLVWVVNGTLDLVCQRAGRTYLLEVKSKRGSLTKTQEKMKAEGWAYRVVFGPDQALEAVGLEWI